MAAFEPHHELQENMTATQTLANGGKLSFPPIDTRSKQLGLAPDDGDKQSVTPSDSVSTTFTIRESETVHASNGGWGWIVTFASFCISLVIDGVNGVAGILFKEFLIVFGGTKGKTQAINSVMYGTLLFLAPVVGVLMRKFGARTIAISGGLIASTGFFLSTFSPNLDVMIFLYGCVGGFGLALLYPTSLVIVGMYFEKRRALATGIAVSGSGVGALVMAPTIEFLLELYGWQGTIWIMSAIVLNTVVCGALYRPVCSASSSEHRKTFEKSTVTSQKTSTVTSQKTSTVTSQRTSLNLRGCCQLTEIFELSLLKQPVFLLQICCCFFNMMGYNIPFSYLPVHSVSVGLSSRESALLISIIGISSIVSRVLVGYISDKSCVNTLVLNSVMLLIGALTTSMVPYYTTFASLAMYSAVYGATTAAFASLLTIILVKLMGLHVLSSALGIEFLCMGVALFIGSPIAGILSEMSGSYNSAFYFGGAVIGLAGLLSLPLSCMARRDQQSKSPEDTPQLIQLQVFYQRHSSPYNLYFFVYISKHTFCL
ncbi:monocarboxylate transporter 12-like [Argopecten irradians]|uniref:monocarboxylate transporter 12-like n=1 Tax=Argopecten irradians TaxID=31199 RepID=UPI00371A79D0